MVFLTRRAAVGALLGAVYNPAVAIVLDLRTKKVIETQRPDLASRWLLPPGSTIKPLTLTALLESGKLRSDEKFPCPRKLIIQGRSFSCSHPPIGTPLEVATAIAYSCNCFVAHFAKRLEPGELARYLTKEGINTHSGAEVQPATSEDTIQMQALGEARILVTPQSLLMAYARLATRALPPVLEGLEGAVEYGTAQLAQLPHVKVAGKTGSVLTSNRARIAWFAGFAPSRNPQFAIVTALQGQSGGLDAAPIARSILGSHF